MTWYQEAVFYHIYPLGLLGAPKVNDFIINDQMPTLKKWIDHISSLGFDALYIGPLFSSKTHGYDTIDYKKIDERLGTNDGFKEFVAYCHDHHVKVVVDGVFNHTSRDFYAFKDIIEHKWESQYTDYYQVDFSRSSPLGDPFDYATWSGYHELPKLNTDNTKVQDMLLDAVNYWIDYFDIDGIRLDCADCLSFDFIKRLKAFTKMKKADFWLMGELIHGDYSRWISDDMLDSSTNYELHKSLFSGHNDHNYFEIAHTIRRQFDPMWGLYKGFYLYNFVDNHDVDRLISKLVNKANVKNVYVLLFTLLGIPSVYYGSEHNIEGQRTPYNDDALRPYIDLDAMKANEITDLIAKLAHLKKDHHSLSYGEYKEVYLTNRQYAYTRTLDDEMILVVTNNDEDDAYFDIKIDGIKKAHSLLDDKDYAVDDCIHIKLKNNDSDIIILS